MTAPTTATGFSITVPDSWFEIELHPDARNAAINTLVSERLKEVPELYEHRADLARVLRETARRAYDSGARFCGTLVAGLGGAVMTATVTVTIVDAPNEEGAADAIASFLTTVPKRGADSIWRQVESVEIPEAGRVPRTRGIDDVTLPDGAGWIRSLIMQTFVPFPGPNPTRVALITGSSPLLALESEFFDVFDAITGTFRFIG
ncbi:hypothetical protein GCM10010435_08690 [Winogradskya consettensis]|uniref:Uncharacterized protein n=2 Tax=Winogradskya TaxID=3240235 RepID=A0A919SXD8_9ACTN|nr:MULTISPECIES: hypothetical protein [Actinoplanes]GIE22243.1 hypothetical protein Ahu01nite_053450 [Actinoplanes humidus]GIM80565.1 hypothetical protein Aco04nite_71410 [Actinoplanes consettensis]